MDWNSSRVCRHAGLPGLALLLLLAASPAAAQPVPAEPRVATLIKDLGDRNFDTRRDAFLRLAKLGTVGREELQRALESEDPEIRLRAGQLLEAIRIEQIWSPGSVTLSTRGQPASQVLKEIARQCGNHVHVGDPYGSFADREIDVEFNNTDYWRAVDEICRRTGNRPRPHYDVNTPGVVVSSGVMGNFPRAYSGPVRAQIVSAKRHFLEELNYEEGKSELLHSFHVNLQFTWEDRFGLVGYATQPELVEGVTDNHVILSSAQPAAGAWNATTRGLRQMNASLKLNPVPVTARKLSTFTIRWGLIAVGEMQVLDITTLEPETSLAQDDVVATIESIEEQTAGKYVVSLVVQRDLAPPDPPEVMLREYDVELLDQRGIPFRVQNAAPSLSERGVHLRTTFHGESADSRPRQIKLHYPRLRARRDVHLTFTDVPLPVEKPE
jgi:hypothetical protein